MTILAHPVRIRWWIFWFTSAFAMLSYIERTSLAVTAKEIMPALHLTQSQIGWLNVAFTAAYAAAQFPGGTFGQQIGARLAYVLVGVVGLMAMLAMPLAPVILTGATLFVALLIAQGLLGLSQGPVFPVFAAVVEAWFPSNRWARAQGLGTGLMNLGGAVTPPLIVILTRLLGWQGALLSLGVPIALLTLAWGWYGRNSPREHPAVTPVELAELGEAVHEVPQPLTVRRLLLVVADRDVLRLTISYLCMNCVFYLLSSWSYLYLVQVRHFGGLESGFVGAMPWIGGGIGAVTGGLFSELLVERIGPRWGYRVVPLLALPIAAGLLLVTIELATPYAAVMALTTAFFAIEMTEGGYWAATMHVARADTGAASGVLNTGGNVGGIIMHPIVGALSGVGGWNTAFVTGTVFALVAAGLWLLIDPNRRVHVTAQ